MIAGNLAYCSVAVSPLRADASDRSEMVSQVLFGELVSVLEVQLPWIRVESQFDGYQGWCDSKQFRSLSPKEAKRWLDGIQMHPGQAIELATPWGAQWVSRGAYVPDQPAFYIGADAFEVVQHVGGTPTTEVTSIALSYLNTPYLWGGKTIFGIDCSGFTQQVFRFLGINLPRDAYQQVDLGQTIDWEDRQTGDVAFFINNQQRIHHVGILLDHDVVIHASGRVRLDTLTPTGIFNRESASETHQLFCLKRL